MSNQNKILLLLGSLLIMYVGYQVGIKLTLAKFPLRSPCHLTYKTKESTTIDHVYILTTDECNDLIQYTKYFQNDTALRVQEIYTNNYQTLPPPPPFQMPQSHYTNCTNGPLGLNCWTY